MDTLGRFEDDALQHDWRQNFVCLFAGDVQ